MWQSARWPIWAIMLWLALRMTLKLNFFNDYTEERKYMSFCARQIQRRMNPSRSHSYSHSHSGKSKALFLQFLYQQYYIHHALEMFRRIKIKFTKKHMIIIITLKMCAHIAYEYEVASNWNCARMKKIVVVYALFMDARVLPHSSTWARHISI